MPGVGDWIGEPLAFVSNFLGECHSDIAIVYIHTIHNKFIIIIHTTVTRRMMMVVVVTTTIIILLLLPIHPSPFYCAYYFTSGNCSQLMALSFSCDYRPYSVSVFHLTDYLGLLLTYYSHSAVCG